MHNISELEIRRKLANLYDSLDQAKLVAGDIGLQLARISFSYPMEICWSNIWREARLQHQELNLIDRVLLDYSSDEKLAHIRHQISQQKESYLFSVATSLNDEISEIDNYCRSRFHKIEYYYNRYDTYSRTFTRLFRTSPSLPSGVYPSYYENIVAVAKQVAVSDTDLVIFIGPAGDTASFLIQLRNEEQQKGYPSHTVLAGDSLYQWVYEYFNPHDKSAFDNARFVAFAYHGQDNFSNDFSNTFDPDGERSGNIYTYRLPSSDAILAQDALSLLTNAQKNTTCTIPCDTSIWEETLQDYIKLMHFKGVSGQISFLSGRSSPDRKCLFFVKIYQEKNVSLQDHTDRCP